MMLTNIEINSAVSEEGHVLTAYGFFLVVRLASMQIRAGFWNPFSRNSGLTLKIYIDPSAWPAGSAVKTKKKKPKGKIVLKKKKNKKNKETENSVAGSRTRFIWRCKQLLDQCTTVTHMTWKNNFVTSKQFFSPIQPVWRWWSCTDLSWIQICIWGKLA